MALVETFHAHSSTPHPVRILKQINRQNEDGSYSYGYENEDGSYKIETKTPDGEVSGKYGYLDASGKLIEIEYGASKRGFEPIGPGITVPPPTIHAQNENNIEQDYDDGQYREDPSIYYKNETPLPKSVQSKFESTPKPIFRYQSAAAAQLNPYQYYRPQLPAASYNADPAAFQGHPANNFDPYSGSYNINF